MKPSKIISLTILLILIVVGAVSAGPLARIYISPGNIALNQNVHQQFKVYGMDIQGNDVPVTGPVTWSVDTVAGTITPDGILTVGTTIGIYPEAVKASVPGGFSAMAGVQIVGLQIAGNYYFDRCLSNGAPSEFTASEGVASDSQGNFYVTDRWNHRVQKFDADGNYLMQWGTYGRANGQFNAPAGITVDSQRRVYVVDDYNARVQVFTSTGQFIRTWGSYGYDDGQFIRPWNIAVDSNYNVYVTDGNLRCINKFDQNGNFITKWGSEGSADGQFNGFWGLAVDKNGTIYVADAWNNRIQLFDSSGNFIKKWDTAGGYKFNAPYGVTIDPAGNIFVADSGIQKFDSTGKRIAQYQTLTGYLYGIAIGASGKMVVVDDYSGALCFDGSGVLISRIGIRGIGHNDQLWAVATDSKQNIYVTDEYACCVRKYDPNGVSIKTWGTAGTANGQMRQPRGIAIDSGDNVYVADYYNNCIKKFTEEGSFITKIPVLGPSNNPAYPWDVAVAPDGSIYVTDYGNCCIAKYDTTGKFISRWGSKGSEDGQFGSGDLYVAVDAKNNVYVSDSYSCRIQKFDSNGQLLCKWGSMGWQDGSFYDCHGISIDSQGYVYVADWANSRIQIFDSNGNYISKWGDRQSFDPGGFFAVCDVAVDNMGRMIGLDYHSCRIQIFKHLLTSLGFTKNIEDGAPVILTAQCVTAGTNNFQNHFYIESADRSSGVKVTGKTANTGRTVSITGVMATVNGEREIQASTCTLVGAATIKPIGMNNRSIGGGQANYQNGVWRHTTLRGEDGKPQLIWAKAQGLNNIGLYVRTWGKVVSVDTAAHTFVISDGTSVDGIKCWAPSTVTLPALNSFVAVKGISSCEKNGQDELLPLLKVRAQNDINAMSN